jgi:hypothetical protein
MTMKPLSTFRLPGWDRLTRKPGASLLGLSLEGQRLEGVVIRRTNGSVAIAKSFICSLSLDPLKDDPALVGREIRKQLDAAGIRERRCVVGLPLNWMLTLTTSLPDLPEPDIASFLEIAAERGFPYSPGALLIAHSRFQLGAVGPTATLVAVPREHVAHLEAALRAAHLRPVSFSLGIAALQPPDANPAEGVLALVPGQSSIALQVTVGGGVTVLRLVEDAFELDGAERRLQMDHLIRELRITLGQLPADIRDSVRRLRVFGRTQAADELIAQLTPRLPELGLHAEHFTQLPPESSSFQLPPDHILSPALSLALQHLSGKRPTLEFLPPKVSPWQRLQARYPAGKLAYASGAVGAIALLTLAAFLIQQWQLAHWCAQWVAMETDVAQLEAIQRDIQAYRPWFDDSFRCLTILRRLTETFPETGSVTAKTIEIRPTSVVCSGTATDNQSLLQTLDRLRLSSGVASPQVEQIRGTSPLQFTFNFQWTEGGQP